MKNYKITVNGKTYDVTVEEAGAAPAAATTAQPAAPAQPKASASAGATTVKAPMPGTILDIKVAAGNAVKKGDVLCILEAMKMENDICAPADGVVDAILVNKGDSVEVNAAIIALK
ncbi:MAG: biotin/lipoyl-binding protein [Clostridia bacterium]|nr:biotin/lipoyl-binding protein [Clostridia bacterium]